MADLRSGVEARPRIGVVVTTLGRKGLDRLIRSVPDEWPIVVSWQGAMGPASRAVEAALATRLDPGVLTPSAGGASAGRNAGVDALLTHSRPDYLLFPNDDTWYPEGFGSAVSSTLSRQDIAMFTVRAPGGDQREGLMPWSPDGVLVDNVLVSSHEPGMVVRTVLYLQLKGFDENLSVGSPGRWQSGEGSDLVARALRAGATVAALDGAVFAFESVQEHGRDLRRKRIRYAPGTAYVLGRHAWMPGSKRRALRFLLACMVRYRSGRLGARMARAYFDGRRHARSTGS